MERAVARILGDEIGEASIQYGYEQALLLRAFEGAQSGFPTKWDFFNGEDRNEVIRETVRAAIEELEAQMRHGQFRRCGHRIISTPMNL